MEEDGLSWGTRAAESNEGRRWVTVNDVKVCFQWVVCFLSAK